ncbi:RNA-directed DNA polymerase, eukaryota, reverse transcriptase zinc-binding domain protein [Tanacetum coccineum]
MGNVGGGQHEFAYNRLKVELNRQGLLNGPLNNQLLASFSAFGKGTNLPETGHRVEGVTYMVTTDSHQSKENTTENTMIAEILSFAFEHRTPSSIIVLTQNKRLTSTLLALKKRGYFTILCIPRAAMRASADYKFLRHAASAVIPRTW